MCRQKLFINGFYSLLILLTLDITIVRAQVDTASITGQVTDPQGAVVAGARIVATNQATNIAVETTTNGEGYYTLTNLRPNLYTIETIQQGFKTDSRKDVELNVGQKARFDFQLTVGETGTIVDVTTDNQTQLQRETCVENSCTFVEIELLS